MSTTGTMERIGALALFLATLLAWAFRLLEGPRKIGLVAGIGLAVVLQDALIDPVPDEAAQQAACRET